MAQRGVAALGRERLSALPMRTSASQSLLHCVKSAAARARITPDAKKYWSTVSFLVVARAFEGYFSVYKTKISGRIDGRSMEADSATRSGNCGRARRQ